MILRYRKSSNSAYTTSIENESFEEILPPIVLPEKKYIRSKGEMLSLRVDGYDVYNITAPTHIGKETYIFGRVEKRRQEDGSRIFAFKLQGDGTWLPIELSLPSLQDPAIAIVTGNVILSGIYVQWDVDKNGKNFAKNYWTVLYTLDEELRPTPQGRGPDQMKDIRLLGLQDGSLLVFGRPQRQHRVDAGDGKVSVTLFPTLSEYDSQKIVEAPILSLGEADDEWVGANHAIEVDGKVWVLGHVGRWIVENGKRIRQYDAMVFVYDPKTGKSSKMQRIITYDQFEYDESKNEELTHIVFSGGFEVSEDKKSITVYVGLKDSAAGKITLENPFPLLADF